MSKVETMTGSYKIAMLVEFYVIFAFCEYCQFTASQHNNKKVLVFAKGKFVFVFVIHLVL